MNLVSFVTVNLNNADGLRRTLESLPYGKATFEHVVVDGGSTDSSLDLLEPYRKFNLKVLSEKDSGIYNAMNKGIELASGDYLNFMNSGDCLVNLEVIDQVTNYSGPPVIWYGDRLTGRTKDLWQYASPIRLSMLVSDGGLSHQSQFIPRQFFEDCGGYDETFRIAGDWAWNIEAAVSHNKPFRHLGEVVCHFEGGGIGSPDSPDHWKVKKERDEYLEQRLPWVLSDMQELNSMRKKEQLQKASGIYKFAEALFRLKNRRTTKN